MHPKGPNHEEELARINRLFFAISILTLSVITFGAIFYHIVEKLKWLDSFYFCVITLTTVGYGDIVPHTDPGKIFTIFYVLTGVGIIATFAQLLLRRAAIKRQK